MSDDGRCPGRAEAGGAQADGVEATDQPADTEPAPALLSASEEHESAAELLRRYCDMLQQICGELAEVERAYAGWTVFRDDA